MNSLYTLFREGLERLRLRPVIMFFIKFQKVVNWRSKLFVESGYEVLTVVCVAGEECGKNQSSRLDKVVKTTETYLICICSFSN